MIKTVKDYLVTTVKGERGVTTVEYAIMLALVAIAVAAAAPGISTAVVDTFDAAADAMS